ncbi:MAG: hypothetical protein KDF59_16360 [Nitrosomonas sp.]|nr:hypothetical protein [Nitrosomonas sp.]
MNKQLNNHLISRKFLPYWIAFSALMGVASATTAEQLSDKDLESYKQLEISGITLAMPLETIAENLAAQGYEAVNNRLFTKRGPMQNNRNTVFRIEIEDNADSRLITYHRSLSGGRVKTAGDPEPVPDYEVDMAQRFYALMCEDVSEAIMEERQCEPLTKVTINAGHGQFIQINDSISMQLNVTAANSAVGIKYRY